MSQLFSCNRNDFRCHSLEWTPNVCLSDSFVTSDLTDLFSLWKKKIKTKSISVFRSPPQIDDFMRNRKKNSVSIFFCSQFTRLPLGYLVRNVHFRTIEEADCTLYLFHKIIAALPSSLSNAVQRKKCHTG